MPDTPNTMTMPNPSPREAHCTRCDGPIDVEGWACCSACAEAANRAITAKPGQVVTPADIEAARRGQ